MNQPDEEDDALGSAWAGALSLAAGQETGQRFTSSFSAYKHDLVRFGREVLGHRYWAGQEAVMRRVLEKKFVTLRKPRKTGGTFAAADLALAFLVTRPSVVIVCAPTDRQIRWNMFAKIRSAHAKARSTMPGVVGIRSVQISEDWFMLGIATRDPENILGFHSGVTMPEDEDGEEAEIEAEDAPSAFDALAKIQAVSEQNEILFIFDEANGVEPVIFDAVSGSLAGENVHALMQANPLLSAESDHPYAASFRRGSKWWRIHISAEEPLEDPTESDECFHEVPEHLLPKKWIDQQRVEWGEHSALFQAFVLGCFTSGAAEFQIIPMDILQAASRYDLPDDDRIESRHMGCDVAGAESRNGDACVAILTINGVVAGRHSWVESDTTRSMDKMQALTVQWGLPDRPILWSNVHIDATGIGKTMVDTFRRRGFLVDAVDFGGRPRGDWKHITGDMKFRDRKSELYWVQRRTLQEGLSIIPPKYQDVWRQLQWQTYKMVPRAEGTVMAMRETKDELRSRYGRSPDDADATVIALSRSNRRPTFRVLGPGSIIRP